MLTGTYMENNMLSYLSVAANDIVGLHVKYTYYTT